jgi:hypothetical protein
MPPSSRRRPFPYDARLRTSPDPNAPSTGNIGVMLVPGQDGAILTGKKQQIVEYPIPNTYEYDSAPLYKERTFIFRPRAGMGERVQRSIGDQRYYFGLNIWCYGGLFGKGPLMHELVPTTTGSIAEFIDAPNAAVLNCQFALAGATILRRTDDTNAGQVADHTRAGQTATSAVHFMSTGTSPVDALYVAWSDGLLEQRSAAGTWVSCALPSGFLPNFLATVGPTMIASAAGSCQLRVCTADPTIAGSWGGPIFIGNPSVPISGMSAAANMIIIFKADGGIFTLNTDGSTNDETPGARVPLDTMNGRTAAPWLNSVYARIGPTFWQIDMPSVTLTPIGPERQLDNASAVYGRVQAFAGWGAQMAFVGIYNATNNASYLCTYGNWEPDQTDSFKFVDQYDGAIAWWPNRRVSALGVSNASGTDRLYVGFTDGGYSWFKLVQNPLGLGSGAEYTTQAASMDVPWHTAMFDADTKAWTGFSIFGPQITQGNFCTISYRLAGTAGGPPPSDVMATYQDLTGDLIYSGFRLDCPPNLNGSMLSLRINLTNFDSTQTPVLEGVGIHERVIPRFRLDYNGTIDAHDWVARRDGAGIRQSGKAIRGILQQFVSSPNLAVIELPDETLDSLALFDYTDHMLGWKVGGSQQWVIDFSASQFATLSVYGIIRRLRGTTIGSLRGYTISRLRVM